MMRPVQALATGALSLMCALLVGCPSLPDAYCMTAADCDDQDGLLDPVGSSSDSAAVCAVNQQTNLDALRANRESICQDLAEAWEAWMACAVEEGCQAFQIFEDECKDEFQEYAEIADDAGGRCNE